MSLIRIEEPGTEPLTLAEVRNWCRVDDDFTGDDADLQGLITTYRAQAEHECGRSFLSTMWERVLDAFPAVELELAAQPVSSIVHVKYLDGDGVEQTLAPEAYVLDQVTEPAFVLPAAGYDWPATFSGINAVRVRFVQGWSSASNPRCAPLRLWMRMHIEAAYKLRGALVSGVSVTELPNRHVERLLDAYRVYGV